MFVDELVITAKAGNGGDGVVRWRREKFIDKGGPAGGDGGRGGHVYVRAVRDLSLLGKYTGVKSFVAEDGSAGEKKSRHGKDGIDLYIDVPVGALVREHAHDRVYTLATEGQTERILRGGKGGLGNEHFKSATNQAPEAATKGRNGESGTFTIELSLLVDVGLIGLPNAGKSTLLNALTNTNARVGAYPFTTLEPHLGDLHGYVLADIPGLIEGAHEGKGLGHKFLKHIQKTKMLLHCVSLEDSDPQRVYETVRTELEKFDTQILAKEEWIILTKSDTVDDSNATEIKNFFMKKGSARVFVTSTEDSESIKTLHDSLIQHLRSKND